MARLAHGTLLLVALASAAWAAACGPSTPSTSSSGASGPGGSGAACFDYGAFDGATPTVSFQTDVLPIFRQSCGLSSSCHGTTSSPGPFLGPKLSDPPPDPSVIEQIFDANVGVPSSAEPSMLLVSPSDPERSFLLHKIDDTLECDLLVCADDDSCGDAMPVGSPLDADKRDVIRRWIAQGAKND